MTAPSAAGTLANTPLAHALVYARNRRLSGRLDLAEGERRASIMLWCGRITSVDTIPLNMCPGGYLGAVAYELGLIDAATLDATLLEVAKTKRPHGEVLVERKALTVAQRDQALVEQIHRKIHHLFSLPDTASYSFWETSPPTSSPAVAVDPLGPVWRGIRDYPPLRFVQETVRRVGDNPLRVTQGGTTVRLPPAEAALLEALAATPMTLAQMKTRTELGGPHVELLVYLLVIARCVEAVSGARTHPSTGQLPVNMPSGPMPRAPLDAGRASGAVRTVATPGTAFPISRPPPSARPAMAPPPSSRIPPMSSPPSSTRPPKRFSSTSIPAVQTASPRPPPAGTLAALRSPSEVGAEGILARAGTIENESLFEVLGIADGASAEAARAAYVRLAKTWHPDRLTAELGFVRGEVTKIFSHMTRAHQTLTDPNARRAYEASRKAVAEASVRPRGEVMRAVHAAMNGRDFDTAIRLTQELIDANPDDAEALAVQAWAGVRGGEATEDELRAALVKMEKAVNVDRTDDQAVYHRGLVHKRLNNVPAAFRDFARAIQLNPKHLEAEREVRIFAMRARKGSGEHKIVGTLLEKLGKK